MLLGSDSAPMLLLDSVGHRDQKQLTARPKARVLEA
jgi:hypothetical protein